MEPPRLRAALLPQPPHRSPLQCRSSKVPGFPGSNPPRLLKRPRQQTMAHRPGPARHLPSKFSTAAPGRPSLGEREIARLPWKLASLSPLRVWLRRSSLWFLRGFIGRTAIAGSAAGAIATATERRPSSIRAAREPPLASDCRLLRARRPISSLERRARRERCAFGACGGLRLSRGVLPCCPCAGGGVDATPS